MSVGHCCTSEPCPGKWPCHYQCVLGDATDADGNPTECDCHCGGKYHGKGQAARNPSWRERRRGKKAARKLAELSEAELDARAAAMNWDDAAEVERVMGEIDRRDRERHAREAAEAAARKKAEQAAKARGRRRDAAAEYDAIARSQHDDAEAATNGYMLSAAGEKAYRAGKLRSTEDLWRMNDARARHYASEELIAHWEGRNGATDRLARGENRRLSPAEYKRQQAAARREERAAAEAHAIAPGVPYGWADMRAQDFDDSIPLSLIDESKVRAGASTRRKKDATGTPDIFD